MRNLTNGILTLFFFLGINASCVQVHSQEHPIQAVQGPSQGWGELVGCYQVALLSWTPPDASIDLIPPRFELLNVPRVPGANYFNIRSLRGAERDPWQNAWAWRPKSNDKLEINWGAGLGGFRGTLKRSAGGELVGKIKEYCDARCGWKRRTGDLHLQKINCEPD
jgi:hypothetical protein